MNNQIRILLAVIVYCSDTCALSTQHILNILLIKTTPFLQETVYLFQQFIEYLWPIMILFFKFNHSLKYHVIYYQSINIPNI